MTFFCFPVQCKELTRHHKFCIYTVTNITITADMRTDPQNEHMSVTDAAIAARCLLTKNIQDGRLASV